MLDSDRCNRNLWDSWTPHHAEQSFYDVDGFRAGRSSLKPVEQEALGDVQGKSILHLQCHFGLDSLSLARAGARVTGVDYSAESIRYARKLSDELKIPAQFLEMNVYDLEERIDETFDIVFTSYGVLHWLHDLPAWARGIHHCLKDRGFFFLVDMHPLFNMLSPDGVKLVFPYFPQSAPVRTMKRGLCMDPTFDIEHVAYEWPHSLSEVLMTLRDAGLAVEKFVEYPYIVFDCLPFLEQIAPGRYRPKTETPDLPMMFSVRATKRPSPGVSNRLRLEG